VRWRELSAEEACPRCGVIQPVGAQIAEYQFGPKRLTRCAMCERAVNAQAARVAAARDRAFRTVPDGATESESMAIQAAYAQGMGGHINRMRLPGQLARAAKSR
jgi:hypothetical protein